MTASDPLAFELGGTWRRRSGGDPRSLAQQLGASIELQPRGLSPTRYAISEFHTRGRRIIVYRDALAALAELIVDFELGAWFDATRLEEIAVVHELFHLLEHAKQVPRRAYRAAAACELAAHAFTQGFLELPRSPALLSELLPLHLARKNPANLERAHA